MTYIHTGERFSANRADQSQIRLTKEFQIYICKSFGNCINSFAKDDANRDICKGPLLTV